MLQFQSIISNPVSCAHKEQVIAIPCYTDSFCLEAVPLPLNLLLAALKSSQLFWLSVAESMALISKNRTSFLSHFLQAMG